MGRGINCTFDNIFGAGMIAKKVTWFKCDGYLAGFQVVDNLIDSDFSMPENILDAETARSVYK